MKTKLNSSILMGLRYFTSAAQHVSFTKAAEELHVTQGAISQQIRQLEERIGVLLFQRQPRGLSLTDEGQRLYIATSKSFHDLEEVLGSLVQRSTALNINCAPSFALQWLIPRLGGFQRLHPEVELKVKAEFHELNRQLMQNSDIDIAIRFDPHPYSDIHATSLMKEYQLPVASPDFVAKHPELMQTQRFTDYPLLHDESPWDGAPAYIEWRTWLLEHNPELSELCAGLQFNLSVLAIGAAIAGQGIAMARSSLIVDELQRGQLIDLFGRPTLAQSRYVLLTVRPENPHIRAFTEWLRAECAEFDRTRKKNNLIP